MGVPETSLTGGLIRRAAHDRHPDRVSTQGEGAVCKPRTEATEDPQLPDLCTPSS